MSTKLYFYGHQRLAFISSARVSVLSIESLGAGIGIHTRAQRTCDGEKGQDLIATSMGFFFFFVFWVSLVEDCYAVLSVEDSSKVCRKLSHEGQEIN